MRLKAVLRAEYRMPRPKDGWAPWIILFTYAVSLTVVDLTDIHRPFHDTVASFYFRIFSSDTLRQLSIPFWYPYMRWSWPNGNLENSVAWSIPGHVIGLFRGYDLLAWAIENLFWNILSITGVYKFARKHTILSWTATIIAISYVSSGLIIGTLPVIATSRALQIGPWVFHAIDVVVDDGVKLGWRSWRRGTGMLAVSAMLWATSAYPGIWLTSPFLVAPYAVARTLGSFRLMSRLLLGSLVAAALAVGMCVVLVDGSVNTPLFGKTATRPYVSPWDGVFQIRTAIYFLLPNPGYLRDPNGGYEPLYLGAYFPLSLLLFRPIVGSARIEGLIISVVRYAAAVLVGTFAVAQFAIGSSGFWVMTAVGLCTLFGAGFSVRHYDRIDTALLVTSIISVLMATDNPMSNVFRAHVPPFTFLRWNSWYLWTGMLCLLVHAWRNVEACVLGFGNVKRLGELPHTSRMIALVGAGLFFLSVAIVRYTPADGVVFSQMHRLTADYLKLASLAGGGVMASMFFVVWHGWLRAPVALVLSGGAFTFLMWSIGAWVTAAAGDTDAVHRLVIMLPTWLPGILDVSQLLGSVIVAGLVLWIFRDRVSRDDRMAMLAMIVFCDLALAAPRYLSQTEYMIAGQVSKPTGVDPAFLFAGNRRHANNGVACSALHLENAYRRNPDQTLPCSATPEEVERERAVGDGTVYASFAHFPPWWAEGAAGQVFAAMPAEDGTGTELAPPADALRPVCGGLATQDLPDGMVTKLLADRVHMRVRSQCRRLVVLADTWAPGWSVTVDGQSQPAIRVNETLRGVYVTAGEHEVEWFYRPTLWSILVGVTMLAFVITAVLLIV